MRRFLLTLLRGLTPPRRAHAVFEDFARTIARLNAARGGAFFAGEGARDKQ